MHGLTAYSHVTKADVGILDDAPRRILIVKPSSLGDVVHSLPLLARLSERFPDAEIDWVIARGLEGLLEGHPMISRLWVIDKDKWKNLGSFTDMISELLSISRNMKERGYDLTIDLQGLLRSGIITWLSGAKVRLGLSDSREGSHLFYTHEAQTGKSRHAVDRYLDAARRLGCPEKPVTFPILAEPYPLSNDDPYAVLVPGARWQTKRWPAAWFGALASRLPISSFVVGSRGDAWLADKVVRHSKGKAESLAGKTNLKELATILHGAKYVITNDTGTMHIAAGLGVRVIAIFGPTDPSKTGPYGHGHAVLTKKLPCSPCRNKNNCPELKCMWAITVDDVLETVMKKASE